MKNWYGNYKVAPLKEETTLVQVGTIWNHRLVIEHLYKDQISKQLADDGHFPGGPGWIGHYQSAVTEFIKSLDDDQVEEYQELAAAWNAAEPPQELKRK